MEINQLYLLISTLFIVYILGSIPFALIIPKIFGYDDVRNIGSGNIGATNVLRMGNKRLALIVLILDIAKGFLPIFILKNYYGNMFEINSLNLIYLIGGISILGHIFPVWLKFKGGKGVATYIGYIFGINIFLGIFFVICWLLIAYFSKYSSMASILSILILPFTYFIFQNEIIIFLLFALIGAIIILKHYSNILRIFNKTENRIRF